MEVPTVEDPGDKADERATRATRSYADRRLQPAAWKLIPRLEDWEYVVRRQNAELLLYRKKPRGGADVQRTRGHDISAGMTLFELGVFMVKLGLGNVVSLDGSGSAAFIYKPEGGQSIENVFHDGRPASDDIRGVTRTGYTCRTHTEIDNDNPGTCRKCNAQLVAKQPETEMYHLEQFLRPRPAANHIGLF